MDCSIQLDADTNNTASEYLEGHVLSPTETFAQRVEATRRRFIEGLPVRLEAVSATLTEKDAPDASESKARKIHRMMHDLAGNAAMLELAEIESSLRRALSVAEEADTKRSALSDTEIGLIDDVLADTRKIILSMQKARQT